MIQALEFIEHVRTASGLNTVEFTSLLPIDRTTYYSWLRGSKNPHPLFLKLCVARAKVIQRHIIDGSLPVGAEIEKKHKMQYVTQLLARQKSTVDAAPLFLV